MSDGEEVYKPTAMSSHRKKQKKRKLDSDDEEGDVQVMDGPSASVQSTSQNPNAKATAGGEDFEDDFSINDLNKVSEGELQAKIAAMERELEHTNVRDQKRKEKEE